VDGAAVLVTGLLYDGGEASGARAGRNVGADAKLFDGADSVVLAGHLMASPGCAVVESETGALG